MKIQTNLISQISLVISFIVLIVGADNDYENNLTKLWTLSSSSRSGGARTAVLNVTSASLLIQPSNYRDGQYSTNPSPARESKMQAEFHPNQYKRYAFKPRAIPLRGDEQPQVERSIHYKDEPNKYKADILLPGNYFPIADVKRENLSEETTFNPLAGGAFRPKIIPLLRSQEFQRRSLDDAEEPIIEKPDGFMEPIASRRSLSLFEDEEEDEEDDEVKDYDGDEEDSEGKKHKKKKVKIGKKYAKYMLPLLLAYKLKFFSMIPLMMGGLVLLVGATGMAGFFFALFAAVMGLQKGSY